MKEKKIKEDSKIFGPRATRNVELLFAELRKVVRDIRYFQFEMMLISK